MHNNILTPLDIEHAGIAAVRLRDAVARLSSNPDHDDPHRAYRRHVTHWWRTTREYGLIDASAAALAASLEDMRTTWGAGADWQHLESLAAEAMASDGPIRTQAIRAILTGLAIDPMITTWDEARGDWAGMVDECGAMTSTECAEHLAVHLRWTIGILVDGDTPAAERGRLVESALAGVATVADHHADAGDQRWAGLALAAIVLDGQDAVARCATLVHTIEEIDQLAEELA